jgi:hypothetical protein
MTREEWDMELISPLPGQRRRAPTEEQLALEAQGFLDLYAQQGGGE